MCLQRFLRQSRKKSHNQEDSRIIQLDPGPAQQGRLGRPWPPRFGRIKWRHVKPIHTYTTVCIAHVPQQVRLGKCRNQRCVLALYSTLLKGGLAFWTLNGTLMSETNASTIPRVAVNRPIPR